MKKYYLFASNGGINEETIESTFGLDSLKGIQIELDEDGGGGCFVAEQGDYARVERALRKMTEERGITMSVLVAHDKGELARKSLRDAFAYFPNQILYLSDVLLKEFAFGDYSSITLLNSIFRNIPEDLLVTAATYIKCGLDALDAADKLIIHRNTFNYRMKQFIELTGLDIRDYHNALILETYFQFGAYRR